MLNDPQVVAACITALGTLAAAGIAAFIAKKFVNQQKLREDLDAAKADIEFLLAVESEHCEMHRSHVGSSNKNNVREIAKEAGYRWSGRFTPGRVKNP